MKKVSYENFYFGPFKEMKNLFMNENFKPENVKELNLANEGALDLPPITSIRLLSNLMIVDLSNNRISSFKASILTQGIPKLTSLNISKNCIDTLNDLVKLGRMNTLNHLDISENPVLKYYLRVQVIEKLFFPQEYEPYDPVKILTATYSEFPEKHISEKDAEINKARHRLIAKEKDELTTEEIQKGHRVSKFAHKNTIIKNSFVPCPINRKSRFPNLITLDGLEITKLEVMRAAGVNSLSELQQDYTQLNKVKKPKRKNEKIHQEYLKDYQRRKVKEAMSKNNNDLENVTGGNYLWEKPLDIIHKNAELNISMEEFKKQEEEFFREKAKKKKRLRDNKEKYLEKILKKKVKLEDYEELENDPQLKQLFRSKKKYAKPKLNLFDNLEYNYNSSDSALSEELSEDGRYIKQYQDMKAIQNNILDTNVIEEKNSAKKEKTKETYTNQNMNSISEIGEKNERKDERKDVEIIGKKVIIRGNLMEKPKVKIELDVDSILPNQNQGLSESRKFEILNYREPQYELILDTKKAIEESRNALQESYNLSGKFKIKNLDLKPNTKTKMASFDQILTFLTENKPEELSKYTGINTYYLRDIIYYVNEYKKSDEPKITEKDILKKMEEKNISLEDLNKLYKQLEVIENVKLKETKVNNFTLKNMERREIENAESNAVLAAHYIRMKKYYNDGRFDKCLKALKVDAIAEENKNKMSVSYKRSARGNSERTSIQRPITTGGIKEKTGFIKNWKNLKELKKNIPENPGKTVEITRYFKEAFPHLVTKMSKPAMIPNVGLPFEEMVEANLRKIQEDLEKKDSKIMTLEEQMMAYAQDIKENAKKREDMRTNIEKHIDEIRINFNEFRKWDDAEHDKRHDKVHCFKRYVKLLREGKIN